MASIVHTITIRNADTGGTRMVGLVPVWLFLKRSSDGVDVAQPVVSEVGQGQYKFTYDAETLGEASGQLDAGATLPLESDRYIDVVLTRDSGRIDAAISSVAAAVWAYITRTLTQTAAEVEEAVSGSDLVIKKSATWSATLTGLGNITGRTKLWFTAKHSTGDTDSKSEIQIEETGGLLYITGSVPASAVAGTLVVNDAVTGSITLTLTDDMTLLLKTGNRLIYDVKWKNASGDTHQLTEAYIDIDPIVTLAV